MFAYNRAILMGYLTADPEVKAIGQNKTVANFTLAINRKWKDDSDKVHEDVTFVDCEAWNGTADIAAKYLTKGSPCHIEGSIKQDKWEDKEGNKRSRLLIRIEQIALLGTRSHGSDNGDQAQTGQREASAAH